MICFPQALHGRIGVSLGGSRKRRSPKRCAAFTLVEICIVSAIVAILVALTISTTKSTMVAVKRTKCLSNLRQLALGVNTYIAEHNGEFPIYGTNSPNIPDSLDGGLWHRRIQDYVQADFSQKSSGGVSKIYLCPVDTNALDGLLSYGMNTRLSDLRATSVNKSVIVLGDATSARCNAAGEIKFNHNLTGNLILRDGSAMQASKATATVDLQKYWNPTN